MHQIPPLLLVGLLIVVGGCQVAGREGAGTSQLADYPDGSYKTKRKKDFFFDPKKMYLFRVEGWNPDKMTNEAMTDYVKSTSGGGGTPPL